MGIRDCFQYFFQGQVWRAMHVGVCKNSINISFPPDKNLVWFNIVHNYFNVQTCVNAHTCTDSSQSYIKVKNSVAQHVQDSSTLRMGLAFTHKV